MKTLRDAVRSAIHEANEQANGGRCTCNHTYFIAETDAAVRAAIAYLAEYAATEAPGGEDTATWLLTFVAEYRR